MRRLTHRLALVLMAACALIGAGWAAPAGGVVGNGTPGSCTQAALNTALTGGGLVTFNCGGPKTIAFTSAIMPGTSATLDGGGVITLTGNLTTRLFLVPPGVSFSLRHIVLDQGNSGSNGGGAVFNHGRLTLQDSTIQFSQAGASGIGGAIFTDGPLTLTDSTFFHNLAGSGGAVYANTATAPLTIAGSRFISNNAYSATFGFGGAIWLDTPAQMTLTDGQLLSNTANHGGAIYVAAGAVLTMTAFNRVQLAGNSSAHDGGAVHNEQGTLAVTHADFLNNSAQVSGGAIANSGFMSAGDVLFAKNHAAGGGGLYVGIPMGKGGFFPTASIAHSTFLSNTAVSEGGGLEIFGAGMVVTVTDAAFTGNTAIGGGGGLIRYDAQLLVARASFTGNSANYGGGVAINNSSSPGASPYVDIRDTTVSGNTASNTGGGVDNQDRLELTNVTLKGNSTGFDNSNTPGVDGRLRGAVLQNSGANCEGDTPSDDAHNFATDLTCALNQNTSHQGASLNPLLGSLSTDPLGVTAYHLPLAGSPLINAGPLSCSPTDQRGIPRVNACDIGAVEFGGLLARLWLPLARR